MRTLLLLVASLLLVTVVPAQNNPSTGAVVRRITAEDLKRMEGEFMRAAAEHGSEGYISYYADDAVELPNGTDAIHGKAEIGKVMTFLDDKSNHLTWTPVGADISSSGDLGYTYGTFEFRSVGKDGKPASDNGKYTSIWKKQSDGSWKVVLDMGNASSR